jgi:hypothetical protein
MRVVDAGRPCGTQNEEVFEGPKAGSAESGMRSDETTLSASAGMECRAPP